MPGPHQDFRRESLFASVNFVVASERHLQTNPNPTTCPRPPPAVSLWLQWEIPCPPTISPSLPWKNHLQTYIFPVLLFCFAYLFKKTF
jgi:hypothetical protein